MDAATDAKSPTAAPSREPKEGRRIARFLADAAALGLAAAGVLYALSPLWNATPTPTAAPAPYCTAENIAALAPALNLLDLERRNLVWLSDRGGGDLAYYSPELSGQYQAAQDLISRMMLACVSPEAQSQ